MGKKCTYISANYKNISAWLSHELIKFKLRVKTIVVVVIVRGTYTDRGTERRRKKHGGFS